MGRDTRDHTATATTLRAEDLLRELPEGEIDEAHQAWFDAVAGCIDPGFAVDADELVDEDEPWGP